MALQDLERTMSRRRYGRPDGGMTVQGYLYLALLIGAIGFLTYMTYDAKPLGPNVPVITR